MKDITEIFDDYLQQYGSIDIAESEFKKNIHEDPDLRAEYLEWCDAVGSSEKKGFYDYCEEYLRSQNDVMKSLSDDDEY